VVDGSPNAAMIALLLGDSLFIVLFAVALRRVPGAIGWPCFDKERD
jgi:hypothetical protein